MIKQTRHSPEAENATKAALKRIRRPLTDILQLELIRMTNWDVFDQNGECAARNIAKTFLTSPVIQAELERIVHAEIVKETMEHNQWMRKIGEPGYNLGPLDNHPDVTHLVPHGMQPPADYSTFEFRGGPWGVGIAAATHQPQQSTQNTPIRAYGETDRPLFRGPLDTEVPNNVVRFGSSTLTDDHDPKSQLNTQLKHHLASRTVANPDDPTSETPPGTDPGTTSDVSTSAD